MASLDIIVPVFNEREALPELLERLGACFGAGRDPEIGSVRFLFIDDGSSDGSHEILTRYIESGGPALCLRFSRNFGHQAAVSAGLKHADADYVAIIDADLQDPPELVPEMIRKLRTGGYHVVYGQRRKRKENLFKRAGYWAFYRLISWMSSFPIPLDAGDFCVMDRKMVQAIVSLPETLGFSRVLRAWVGFRQTSLPYDRPARTKGKTKYRFKHLYQLATDGIASASIRPLKIAQGYTFLFGGLFLALAVYLGARLWWSPPQAVEGWMMFLGILISFTAFGIFSTFYIMGAYLGRMYLEVKGRPQFVVMESIGKKGHNANEIRAAG